MVEGHSVRARVDVIPAGFRCSTACGPSSRLIELDGTLPGAICPHSGGGGSLCRRPEVPRPVSSRWLSSPRASPEQIKATHPPDCKSVA
jgi:hypothetical protein